MTIRIPVPPDEPKDGPKVVDLVERRRQKSNEPFFEVKQPWQESDKCAHANHGVALHVRSRSASCRKCGEPVDLFDALLMYARGERRLQDTRHYIEEDRKRKAEQEARRPFSKKVEGYEAQRRGTEIVGYVVTLSCGHKARWGRKRPPRTMTCEVCYLGSKRDIKAVPSPNLRNGR